MADEKKEIDIPTKIRHLKEAIDGLEGIPIPYTIIKHQLNPTKRMMHTGIRRR